MMKIHTFIYLALICVKLLLCIKNGKKLRNYNKFRITYCPIDFYLNMATKVVNLLERLLGKIKSSYFSQEAETKMTQNKHRLFKAQRSCW